jgi:hypothetical protein
LNANLTPGPNQIAEVFADTTPANNGTYIKIGAAGTGSWSQILDVSIAGYIATESNARIAGDAAEIVARSNADSTETASRIAADAAETALRLAKDALLEGIAVNAKGRPGDNPGMFTRTLTGPGVAATPLDPSLAIASPSGVVYRVTGAYTVAPREPVFYDKSRVYAVRAVYARFADPADHSGDRVQVKVKWLDQNFATVGSDFVVNSNVAKASTGSFTVVTQVKAEWGATPPPGTVYFRVYVQTFGTDGVTDILEIRTQDVTDSGVYSPDVTVLASRVTTLEGQVAILNPLAAGVANGLATLDSLAQVPESQLWASGYSHSRAYALTRSIPSSVVGFRTGGYAVPGDGGGEVYIHASGTTPGGFQSADGQWWQLGTCADYNVRVFGAKGDGTTVDTTAATDAVSRAVTVGGAVSFPPGTYPLNNLQLVGTSIRGTATLKAAAGAPYVLSLGCETAHQWRYKKLSLAIIDGNARASVGIDFNNNGTSDQVAGRWLIEDAIIQNCSIGIHKRFGNIGNRYRGLNLKFNSIGYQAVGQTSPIMPAGCETFESCEIDNNDLAGIIVDSPQGGSGQFSILQGTIVEYNPGFGLLVKNFKNCVTPFLIDSAWFEGNATAGSVTIDGVVYTPRDILLINTDYAVIKGTYAKNLEFQNSKVLIDGHLCDDSTFFKFDSLSSVRGININLKGMIAQPLIIESVSSVQPSPTSALASIVAVPRLKASRPHRGTKVTSQNFDGTSAIAATAYGGAPSITSTQVLDGPIYGHYSTYQLVSGPGGQLLGVAGLVTSGRWYVITMDVLQVVGALTSLSFNYSVSISGEFAPLLGASGWQTLCVIGQAQGTGNAWPYLQNTSGGPVTVGVANYQIIEFPAELDAIRFFNDRGFVE